jgi:hypothetical protein
MLIKHLAPALAACSLLMAGSALHAQNLASEPVTALEDFSPLELTSRPSSSSATRSNQASITQASDMNIAYVAQMGTVGNYALINQSANNASLAVITQSGNLNRATIIQH